MHPSIPGHYRAALAGHGIDASPASVRRALRRAGDRYRVVVRSGVRIESDRAAAAAFWRSYNETLLAALGVRRARRGLAAALAEGFYAPTSWRRFPETTAVLRQLRAEGVAVGIVSNFTPALLSLGDALGLTALCQVVLASTLVGSEKPDASIFRLALRRLGADPRTTIHVGDTYATDVLGARGAGITPVLVARRDRRPRLSAGDGEPPAPLPSRLDCAVVSDLVGVLAIVRATPGSASLE